MKKLHIFLILIFVIPVYVFSQGQNNVKKRKQMNKSAPPGTVWLKDNLYIDVTEVTNENYREYTLWLNRNSNIKVYKKALPDTLVWRSKLAYNEPYVEYYFRHPTYNNHPVVGVSPKQLVDYCNWRSERAKEHFLLIKGELTENDIINLDKREYVDSLIKLNDKHLKYRLPTKKEWEFAAKANTLNAIFPWEGTSFLDTKAKPKANCFTSYGKSFYTAYSLQDDFFLRSTDSYYPNDFGLYCMGGNVAEMVYKKNPVEINNDTQLEDVIILKGGSWMHASFHAMINIQDNYEGINSSTGFRCVCEYKLK